MTKPKRQDGTPAQQPGDDVGPLYLDGDEGSSAQSSSAQPGGTGDDAADTLRDPDVERRRREEDSARRRA